MTEEEQKYITSIENDFPDSFIGSVEFRGDLSLILNKKDVFKVMKFLKESDRRREGRAK